MHFCIATEERKSILTEEDVLITLTTHARHIADSVLSIVEAGKNLEIDIRVRFLGNVLFYVLIVKKVVFICTGLVFSMYVSEYIYKCMYVFRLFACYRWQLIGG